MKREKGERCADLQTRPLWDHKACIPTYRTVRRDRLPERIRSLPPSRLPPSPSLGFLIRQDFPSKAIARVLKFVPSSVSVCQQFQRQLSNLLPVLFERVI